MADIARRFYGPGLVTNSVVTKITVTTSSTFIIRHMRFFNNSASAATITVSIGTDAAGTRIYDAYSIPAKSYEDWSGFLVMSTTEIMQMVAGTTNVITATVSGVEVTA